jgi:two-component system, NarL family, sensor histidine kinase DesK
LVSSYADDERHRFRRRALARIYGSTMTRRSRRDDWLVHAGRAVLAFSVLVPVVELWRIGVLGHGDDLAVAIGATAAYLPLHLRHVYHALQGRRPRAAVGTLAVMAAVMVVAWWLIGQQWVFMFASLAVSALCALPTRYALAAAAAIVLWPLLYDWSPPIAEGVYSGPYLSLSLLFRATSLFAVVWLVAASRRLSGVRTALAAAAVSAERAALQEDLRTRLGRPLGEVAATSARADAFARRRDPATADVVAELVTASRTALTDVTRLVDVYQRVAARPELEAAAALLTGAGIDADMVRAARESGPLVLPAGADAVERT